MKDKPPLEKNIHKTHTEKELISKIYEQLLRLHNKKTSWLRNGQKI